MDFEGRRVKTYLHIQVLRGCALALVVGCQPPTEKGLPAKTPPREANASPALHLQDTDHQLDTGQPQEDQLRDTGDYSPSPKQTQNGGSGNRRTTTTASDPPEPTGPAHLANHFKDTAQRCGDLLCYSFDTAALAMHAVLQAYDPQVLAFGEAHAPAHFEEKTTVARFTDELLPLLAPSSSSLTVEILAPPKHGCQKEKQVAQSKSDEITSGQRQENQNEYSRLGVRARTLGVIPDILRATCADLQLIAAPEGGVLAYMETIARLFEHDLISVHRSASPARPRVLSYGGALHNDVHPRAERETWSFAPALLAETRGSFIEVDLMLADLVGSSETWRSFAWYHAYQAYLTGLQKLEPSDRTALLARVLLILWGNNSLALIFPSGPSHT